MSSRILSETEKLWSDYDNGACGTAYLKNKMADMEIERDEMGVLVLELRDVLDDWECLWRDRMREISGMTFAAGYPVVQRTRELLTKTKEVLP